nr:hypothetical protein [Saprospiraceae bacterium]
FLEDAFVQRIRNEVLANIELRNKFPTLSVEELTAIKVYTSNQKRNGEYIYKSLNSELRDGTLSDFSRELNDLIKSSLDKLPTYHGTVYRGVYGKEAEIALKWTINDVVHFIDFKSSSIDKQIAAYDFASANKSDVLIEIIGANGKNICEVSCIPDEMEVLLNSNLAFKVTKIELNDMIFDRNFNFQKPFTRIVLEKIQ